jgi:hypothetical protein
VEHSAQIDNGEIDVERVHHAFRLKLDNLNNYFAGNKEVDTDAASDGYWLFLKPKALSSGRHIIRTKGSGPDANGKPFNTSGFYDIEVS